MNFKLTLSTLALLFMAGVKANEKLAFLDIHQENVSVSQEGGEYDLDIASNTPFSVKLAGNPSTGYTWFLRNVQEVQTSNIVSLKGQDYQHAEENIDGGNGEFIFNFEAKDVCEQEIPRLNFAYERGWETAEPYATAIINLKGLCEKKQEAASAVLPEEPKTDATNVLEVENNKVFNVELKGNPTTGFSWSLDNEEELKSSDVVQLVSHDYIEDEHEEDLVGVGGKFIFKFIVMNGCGKTLPNLLFSYKQPWDQVEAAEKAEYTLKLADDCVKPAVQNKSKQLNVNNNEEFTVEIDGNVTTGYSWLLANEEEVASSGVVELINSDYVEDNNGLDGRKGKFVFTFKVNEACGKQLPQLEFINVQPWNDEDQYVDKVDYNLVLSNC